MATVLGLRNWQQCLVNGVKIAVGGKAIIPGHAMVLNGRILLMIATVVKSIPNQVELLIGLPVILSCD